MVTWSTHLTGSLENIRPIEARQSSKFKNLITIHQQSVRHNNILNKKKNKDAAVEALTALASEKRLRCSSRGVDVG
jgi:hypothetical protein